jgi:glycosyltransferase involved in cell wall biosynthesis
VPGMRKRSAGDQQRGRATRLLSAFRRGSGPELDAAEAGSAPSGIVLPPAETMLPSQTGAPSWELSAGHRVTPGPDWAHLPVLDSGLDLSGIERRRARQATRKALGWHGKFVIAHLGTMGLMQGLEHLAPALRHLAGVQPDVLVSFLGNGCQRDALIHSTAGLANVEIRDPVPHDQHLAVLLAADLLLISERGLGSQGVSRPQLLHEYFSSGRPVLAVVYEGSGLAADLEASRAAVLVSPDDPLGFTAEVAALRADPDCRTRLGDAGMRYAEQVQRQPA